MIDLLISASNVGKYVSVRMNNFSLISNFDFVFDAHKLWLMDKTMKRSANFLFLVLLASLAGLNVFHTA